MAKCRGRGRVREASEAEKAMCAMTQSMKQLGGLGTANHTVTGGVTGSRLDGQEAARSKEFESLQMW